LESIFLSKLCISQLDINIVAEAWMLSLIFVVPIVIFGILMLFGRGGSLLAGYNTATSEQKKKFDEKRLLRIAGIMIISFAVLFELMLWLQDIGIITSSLYVMIIPLIPIIVGVLIANSKYVKNEQQ